MKYNEALVISENIINEGNKLKRLENYHSKHGYVIISANRKSNTEIENNRNKNLLKKELERTGLGFRLVKGYYKEEGQDPDLEKSFLVYARKNGDSEELYKFAERCCRIFGQDSVLIAKPNQTPQYFQKDGKKVDWATFNKVLYGEDAMKQIAFTSFKKISHNKEKYKNSGKKSQKENAFSFVEQ